MKLTVLVDNNTLIDRYFLAEPGVSYLIEDEEKKVLFDVGYTEVFLRNAQKMGKNMLDVDVLALSHGHIDHTGGLDVYVKFLIDSGLEGKSVGVRDLVAHPDVFSARRFGDVVEGSNLDAQRLGHYFDLNLQTEPVWLTSSLVFLGEIERTNDFECQDACGEVMDNGEFVGDFLLDDTALAYKSKEGIVVITACSHSGICNIIEYAKKVCDDDRVLAVIGGFHLQNPGDRQIQGTLNYFQDLDARDVYACHCTDLNAKIALAKVCNVREVGVGLELDF